MLAILTMFIDVLHLHKKAHMRYGYARVSRPNQNLDLQLDALQRHGVDYIFEEKISGKIKHKPILESLIKKLKAGDQLIIWKIDRLGRKSGELIKLQESLERREIALVSLTESVDTSTPTGKFAFQVICSVAELERNQLSERTIAGLAAAREKGRIGGRPIGLTPKAQSLAKLAVKEYTRYLQYRDRTIQEICSIIGVSRATFYKYLKIEGLNIKKI